MAAVLGFLLVRAAPSAAKATQSLTPTSFPAGSAGGNALVTYDPGSSGSTKSVADQIASNLQAQGYFVDLAGIDSKTTNGNLTQYQVIVVGGPLEDGKASSSVQSFLENLTPANGTQIGVFGVGTSNTSNDQIAPLPAGSSLLIKETLEINAKQDKAESAEFVTQLLS